MAATLAACGGDHKPVASAATVPSGDEWERVVPGGDCQCADGSAFNFWVRKASPKKVVFYLQDGGACFSAESCAPKNGLYQRRVSEGPVGEGGIFAFDDERNPFADYSVVYVPYCTGDVHIGTRTRTYAPGLTVHHNGYLNGTTALDHLAAAFPGATDVVVIGESAGAVAAPLYAGLAADRLPKARITALADGSGAYPDVPAINRLITDWRGRDSIADWPKTAGAGTQRVSVPGLFIRSGRHDPEIVFARHDYAYDKEQQSKLSLIGVPVGNLLSRLDTNETQIEKAGVKLLTYVAPAPTTPRSATRSFT